MENRNDYSKISEGEAASRNMSGANEPGQRSSGDLLSTLADVHKRLSAVEADNAAMRAEMERAKERDGLDIDPGKLRHVLMKYFPHDDIEPEVAAPRVPKFDPFTGQALN